METQGTLDGLSVYSLGAVLYFDLAWVEAYESFEWFGDIYKFLTGKL